MATLALDEGIYHQACFHAQQCVEEALKAALVLEGTLPPKVHYLGKLLSQLKSSFLEDLRPQIVSLDRFYIPTRYPDAWPGSLPEGLPNQEDARAAVEIAEIVVRRVKAKQTAL